LKKSEYIRTVGAEHVIYETIKELGFKKLRFDKNAVVACLVNYCQANDISRILKSNPSVVVVT
jgi:hypothetical protein